MSRSRVRWAVFILISTLFVGSIVAVNIWISGQINDMQTGISVSPHDVAMPQPVATQAIHKNVSTVRIDPNNDLLAPRKKQVPPAQIKPRPSNAAPVYEISGSSVILAQ